MLSFSGFLREVSESVMFIRLCIGLLVAWFVFDFSRFSSIMHCSFNEAVFVTDIMAVSGFAISLTGLFFATFLEGQYKKLIEQISRDGVVDAYHASALTRYVAKAKRKWIMRATLFIGVCAFVGNLIALGWGIDKPFLVAVTLTGLLIGNRLGSVAAHGAVAKFFHKRRGALRLLPAHHDGAGGSARLGQFALFSGLLIMPIILFLLFWIYNSKAFAVECGLGMVLDYDHYITYFWFLIIVASIFLYFGAIRPVINLRPCMRRAKGFLEEIHQRENEASTHELVDNLYDANSKVPIDNRIEAIKERLESQSFIYALPEFPLSKVSAALFRVSRLTPVVSIFLGLLPLDESFGKTIKQVTEFFVSLF